MIIDLDAHQGNGHETDFSNDSMITFVLLISLIVVGNKITSFVITGRVYILDVFNPGIYPFVSHLLFKLLPQVLTEISETTVFLRCNYAS